MKHKASYEAFAEMAETLPVVIYGWTERAETIIGRHIDISKILFICDDDASLGGRTLEGIPIYPAEKLREEASDTLIVIAQHPPQMAFLRVKSWGFSHVFSHSTFMFRTRSYLNRIEFLRLYAYVLNDYAPPKETSNPYPDKIWMFWDKGYENMPDLIRHCYHSIQRQVKGREIILIDESNMARYAPLPRYILDKYRQGFISVTHFSDILRLVLLENYGGLWIDATVFLSGPLPRALLGNHLFVYRLDFVDGTPRSASNSIIASNPHNPVIEGVRKCLFEYWKYEYCAHDYYIMHIYWDLVTEYAPLYSQEWEKVDFVSLIPSFIMYHDLLFAPFDKKKWDALRQRVSVHKLTYKNRKEDFEIPGTLYQEIVAKEYD